MTTWTISRIESSLLQSIGKIAIGIATPATINCVRIACREVARRQAEYAGFANEFDLRKAVAIAEKASKMID